MVIFRASLFFVIICFSLEYGVFAQTTGRAENWYEKSFYMFLLDYHTRGDAEVGKDASLDETIELLKLSRPDAIMVHAKGNPGWTSYPSDLGHTPPKLANDMMQMWKDAADSLSCHFSAYFNLGRDAEIMKRKPGWNRLRANGQLADRALCYNSGVVEGYLLPMIGEIMEKYSPEGFWFDGSCFTVENCYCEHCRSRFLQTSGLKAPLTPDDNGWDAYKEMQRQIYRETLEKVAHFIKQRDPDCLVAVNLAYGIHMPEKAPDFIDYLTCDMGNEIDNIPNQVIWFDGQDKPFDMMTTTYYSQGEKRMPKPKGQLEQELAIIIANGGKYWAWDNPSATGELSVERFQLLGEVVAPFLRSRQEWCTNSHRMAEVSLFQGSAAHYAFTRNSAFAFLKRNDAVFNAGYALRKLHLNYETISDDRLTNRQINGKLLVVEDPLLLTDKNIDDIILYVKSGGTILLTGRALTFPKLAELSGVEILSGSVSLAEFENVPSIKCETAEGILMAKGSNGENVVMLAKNRFEKGVVYSAPVALFADAPAKKYPFGMGAEIMKTILPDSSRLVLTDASPDCEVYLRKKENQKILHLVNMAEGHRTNSDYTYWNLNASIRDIPMVPGQKISLKLDKMPSRVLLQPQNIEIKNLTFDGERLIFTVPPFNIHQMVIVE